MLRHEFMTWLVTGLLFFEYRWHVKGEQRILGKVSKWVLSISFRLWSHAQVMHWFPSYACTQSDLHNPHKSQSVNKFWYWLMRTWAKSTIQDLRFFTILLKSPFGRRQWRGELGEVRSTTLMWWRGGGTGWAVQEKCRDAVQCGVWWVH